MTHRTRFTISVAVSALTVIVMMAVAPGTNSRFTDGGTGTTSVSISNDPADFPQPEVEEVAPSEQPTSAEVPGAPETPEVEPAQPTETQSSTPVASPEPSPSASAEAEPTVAATQLPEPTSSPEEGGDYEEGAE